jgi:anti-anti-sigma factor
MSLSNSSQGEAPAGARPRRWALCLQPLPEPARRRTRAGVANPTPDAGLADMPRRPPPLALAAGSTKAGVARLACALVGLALLLLSPLLERGGAGGVKPPATMLGVALVLALAGVAEAGVAAQMWRLRLRDAAACLYGCARLAVAVTGLPALALPLLIRAARSATASRAAGPAAGGGGGAGRDQQRAADGGPDAGLLLLRLPAPLYFANRQWAAQKVAAARARAEALAAQQGRRLRFVVWDLEPVHHMDAAGVELLRALAQGLRAQGASLALAAPSPRVAALLEASGLAAELGPEWVFGSAAAAEQRCRALLLGGAKAGGAKVGEAAPAAVELVADARAGAR